MDYTAGAVGRLRIHRIVCPGDVVSGPGHGAMHRRGRTVRVWLGRLGGPDR